MVARAEAPEECVVPTQGNDKKRGRDSSLVDARDELQSAQRQLDSMAHTKRPPPPMATAEEAPEEALRRLIAALVAVDVKVDAAACIADAPTRRIVVTVLDERDGMTEGVVAIVAGEQAPGYHVLVHFRTWPPPVAPLAARVRDEAAQMQAAVRYLAAANLRAVLEAYPWRDAKAMHAALPACVRALDDAPRDGAPVLHGHVDAVLPCLSPPDEVLAHRLVGVPPGRRCASRLELYEGIYDLGRRGVSADARRLFDQLFAPPPGRSGWMEGQLLDTRG